jgi:hypothetical protein
MGNEFHKHSTDGAKASAMTLPLQTSPGGANDQLLSYKRRSTSYSPVSHVYQYFLVSYSQFLTPAPIHILIKSSLLLFHKS